MNIKFTKLDEFPKHGELHHLADYFELLCLLDRDHEFGVGRLADRLQFADDLQETNGDAQDGDEPDVIDSFLGIEMNDGDSVEELVGVVETSLDVDEYDLLDAETTRAYETYGRDAELRDKRDRWCSDLFAHIAFRSDTLGEDYPFEVHPVEQTISLRPVSPERLFYAYFLLCSSQKYLAKRSRSAFTTSFEFVAADSLAAVLPERAVVDVFGTARDSNVAKLTAKGLYKRIGQLARELGGKRHVSKKDFHPKDTADGGLDIVAWIPLPGGQEGIPTFFGQCACGTGWRGKQHEADYLTHWRNYLKLVSIPVTVTFIPYFFRKPGGFWYSAGDVDTVLFDRLRIMALASEANLALHQDAFELAHAAWTSAEAN